MVVKLVTAVMVVVAVNGEVSKVGKVMVVCVMTRIMESGGEENRKGRRGAVCNIN